MNFADQVAAGVVATDAVFLRIGPTHAGPDVAFDIAFDEIRARNDTLREECVEAAYADRAQLVAPLFQ